MRKHIFIISLIIIIALALTGCGGEPASDPPAQEESPAAENEVVEEVPEIEEEELVLEEEADTKNPLNSLGTMENYYYEMETQVDGEVVATSKIWVSGDNSRFESETPGNGELAIVIMNSSEGVSYVYTPSQNMAFKMPIDPEDYSEDADSDENVDFIENFKMLSDDDSVSIEDGSFEGEPAQIITEDLGESNTIIWISKKTGFPLKTEFYVDGDLEAMTLFKDFNNDPIDQSIFTIPDGVQVMDMMEQP